MVDYVAVFGGAEVAGTNVRVPRFGLGVWGGEGEVCGVDDGESDFGYGVRGVFVCFAVDGKEDGNAILLEGGRGGCGLKIFSREEELGGSVLHRKSMFGGGGFLGFRLIFAGFDGGLYESREGFKEIRVCSLHDGGDRGGRRKVVDPVLVLLAAVGVAEKLRADGVGFQGVEIEEKMGADVHGGAGKCGVHLVHQGAELGFADEDDGFGGWVECGPDVVPASLRTPTRCQSYI